MPLLELRRLSKRFGDFAAVDDLSLDIAAGEFLTLLGASGSGKTTTLRMIAGFERPSGGEILMAGAPIAALPPFKRDINTVFQHYALFPHMSVRDNIGYGLRMRGVPAAEREDRVTRALAMVKLDQLGGRAPRQLSGGQQQRVALARALVNRPRVLLLDEPLGALDLKLRKEMQLELKHLQASLGITFVYVTHDQEEALTMSDRIVLLRQGRIAQTGTPRDLYDRPASRYVADFIGETNLLAGVVAESGSGLATLRAGDTTLRGLSDRMLPPGTEAWLTVRPEAIRMEAGTETSAGHNVVTGTVSDAVYAGSTLRVHAAAPRRKRQRAHGLEPGLEPVRRGLQLAARRRRLGDRAAADALPALAGQPGGDGDELWRTDGQTVRRSVGMITFGTSDRPTVRPSDRPTDRPPDRLTAALWLAGSLVLGFIYLPLVVVIVYAFHDSPIIACPLQFGTLKWFGALAHDRGMLAAALASLKLALLAVVIALLVGVPGAFVLGRSDFPGKTAFRRLVLLPLILPGIITGVALLTFFSLIGMRLSSGFPLVPGWPVVLGHAAALTSVVITQVFARLQRLDRAQEEASQDLYANEWQTFRHVTFPNIRTAVLGAGLLVFTLSLDEIAVTFFLIGRQNTLPLHIWGLLRRGITPEVNAAATVIFVLSVLVIVVWARLMGEDQRG